MEIGFSVGPVSFQWNLSPTPKFRRHKRNCFAKLSAGMRFRNFGIGKRSTIDNDVTVRAFYAFLNPLTKFALTCETALAFIIYRLPKLEHSPEYSAFLKAGEVFLATNRAK